VKITDVKVEIYRWPRHRPIRNGMYVYAHSGLNLLKIETDQGITGLGFAGGLTDDGKMVATAVNHFKNQIIGMDPLNNEQVWAALWQPKLIGRRGVTTRAISGIDIGLWDIRGKVANMPVYKLLGGFSSAVPVYIAGGYYEEGKGLKDLAQEMEAALKMGATAVKMKIGGVPIHEDVERVRVVRETVGPKIKVMVDANCAYRHYDAVRIAAKMEPYDPFWFEEPVSPDDYKGHAHIAQHTTIPIATGENEYTRYGFRDLIENRSASILQPDPLIMGGITEIKKVAALAEAHDIPISPHGMQDIGVHVVAGVSNGLIVEYYSGSTDPMYDRTFKNPLLLNKGLLNPPERPGFGVELNEKELAKYRVG